MTRDFSSDIVIIEDSREQHGYGKLFQTPCILGGLTTGDYSVAGLEDLIAVERKSFLDLLSSVTHGRKRFETELKRARVYHRFYVVLVCSPRDLLVEDFGRQSKANPRSVWGTVMVWSTRYAPFLFGYNRETSARMTEALLVAYAKEHFKRVEAAQRGARISVHAETQANF